MYRFRYVVTTQPETVFYADYIAKRKINEILLRKQLKNRRIHDIINLLYSEIKRYEENNKKGVRTFGFGGNYHTYRMFGL